MRPMQLFQELDLPQSCHIDAFLCFAKPDLLDGNNFASLLYKGYMSQTEE